MMKSFFECPPEWTLSADHLAPNLVRIAAALDVLFALLRKRAKITYSGTVLVGIFPH